MIRKLLFFFSVCLSIYCNAAFAQSLSLQDCIKTGLERNYDIRIVRNEEKISENNLSRANAGQLPTIDLSAGYSGELIQYSDGKSLPPNEMLDQGANVGLNLAWTLFDGWKMQTNYSRLKEYRSMGELRTRQVIENWITDLVAEYYNYVNQNLRLANLKYAVSLSSERMRIAAEKYYIGSDSRLDMLQAKVDLNADSSNLIKQYETVYTSGINLNRMMAVDNVSKPVFVVDTAIVPNPMLEEATLRQSMQTSNFALLLADKNLTISQLDTKGILSYRYPYLKFNAGYGYTVNTTSSPAFRKSDNLGLSYGFTVGMNIFDGRNNRREYRNSLIETENRRLELEKNQLTLEADFANMWMAYRNNLDLIELEKENLQTARENYEIAIDRYRLGTLSGIELREAQNSLLNAEERLLEAQFNTKLCEISLMQISGKAGEYFVN